MNDLMTINGSELEQQGFNGGKSFTDFVQWIDRGEKTARTYLVNFRQFLAWLNYTGIKNPERKDIILYREWLTAEHEAIQLDPGSAKGWKYRKDGSGRTIKVNCKAATIRAYLRIVCQFFRWTAANGLYPDIAANIHAPKMNSGIHHKDALTAAEVLTIEQSIVDNAEKRSCRAATATKDFAGRLQRAGEQGRRLYAIYLLTVNCGLRTIEISRANVQDLETRNGQTWLYVWGKGRSEADQKKPLAPEVAEAVYSYLEIRSDKPTANSPLFVATGNRSGGKRLATTTISTMLKKAMQQAGFNSDRITAHSLRHTAGTAVQELTGDLYTTQKYMRHSNPATTEIYLHNETERQETAIAQQLYNYYHGQEQNSSVSKLETLLQSMTPAQIAQLTGIAAAMAN